MQDYVRVLSRVPPFCVGIPLHILYTHAHGHTDKSVTHHPFKAKKKSPGQREFPNLVCTFSSCTRRSTERNKKSNPSILSPPPPPFFLSFYLELVGSLSFHLSADFAHFSWCSPLLSSPLSLLPRGTCAAPLYVVSFYYHTDRDT